MKSHRSHIGTFLLTGCILTSCDVHVFPTPEPEPPVPQDCVMNLTFNYDDFDFLTNIIIGEESAMARNRSDVTRDLRHIVRIYPHINDGNARSYNSRSVIDYITTTSPYSPSHPDVSLPLSLEPGEYDIAAWTDYVEVGSAADLYYNTDDFMEIRLPGAGEPDYVHTANDNFREAWRGTAQIIVKSDKNIYLADQPDKPVNSIEIEMLRPVARYHFITNDLSEFIGIETSWLNKQNSGIEETAGKKPLPQHPDPDDYRVVIHYAGYMPCAYNLFTDKPVDSSPGVSYEGAIRPLDNNRAELAFDHVFVNHNETSVQVSLELYRRSDGRKLSSTGVVDVPLRRGHYTTIEGKLLTTMAGASMGIVPDFNGEFNIEIH